MCENIYNLRTSLKFTYPKNWNLLYLKYQIWQNIENLISHKIIFIKIFLL